MIVQDLVLLGGGHSHLFVLKSFGMRPIRGLRLTLISAESYAAYSGMLPGLIAGHYSFEEAHIDLRKLAAFAGARFIRATVTGIDPDAQQILLSDRPPVSYDLCSINIGSTPTVPPEFDGMSNGVPVKPVGQLLAWLEQFERCVSEESQPQAVTVVGAGAGGVELALALAHRFRDQKNVHISLNEQTSEILPGFPAPARRTVRRALEQADISVRTGIDITGRKGQKCSGGDGANGTAEHTIFATGARPASWLSASGLALSEDGFLKTDDRLRSSSHMSIFAAGDTASQINHMRPKAGVFAVRQGPVLAENLRQSILGGSQKEHRPQSRFLAMLSLGERRAVAVRNGMSVSGAWVWLWKDRIDRRFMRRFADFPSAMRNLSGGVSMEAGRPIDRLSGSDPGMHCLGCGSKVPGDILASALARLRDLSPSVAVADRLKRDDAYVMQAPGGHEIVQSIDFFPALVDDPYVFGQISAAHALSDLYAMGAKPLHALANVVLPYASRHVQEEELFQLLAGAVSVLDSDGAILAGGHSTEGERLGAGFAVTGMLPDGTAIPKRGLSAGDRLILTKPIGTGAVFAAAMRQAAKGDWVDAAIGGMVQSNGAASDIIRRHDVSALSDVTGFGLGGHLAEMLASSELGAAIDISAIPLLPGVEDIFRLGVESTIAPANLRLISHAMDLEAVAPMATSILTDPQTAGGLLAGVTPERADDCVIALRGSGYGEACIVGSVKRRQPEETLISLV